MVKSVSVRKFKTSDGLLFQSRREANRHEALLQVLAFVEATPNEVASTTLRAIELAEFIVDNGRAISALVGKSGPRAAA